MSINPGTVPGVNSGEKLNNDYKFHETELFSSTMFTRRNLLRASTLGIGTLALGRVLSACGGSSDGASPISNGDGSTGDTSDGTGNSSQDGPISPEMSLVQRWVPDQLTPGFVRLPISLADNAGLLRAGPAVLTGKIINYLDNSVVAENLSAERLSIGPGTPPFWVFNATLTDPNVYALVIDGGPEDGAALQIRDGEFMPVPRVGQTLPSIETPTVDDSRGVETICTRIPQCPFHDLTLAQALATGKRVVFLVGTPAHCQTAVCAPVLDALIDLSADYPDVVFLHVDVYADAAATVVAPTIQELSLTFEPVLWITDTTGTITHRFEGVWHHSEIIAALSE